MKHPVKLYPTLPHHGDRFGRMWEAYHARQESLFWTRFAVSAQIILGATAGLVAAWAVM